MTRNPCPGTHQIIELDYFPDENGYPGAAVCPECSLVTQVLVSSVFTNPETMVEYGTLRVHTGSLLGTDRTPTDWAAVNEVKKQRREKRRAEALMRHIVDEPGHATRLAVFLTEAEYGALLKLAHLAIDMNLGNTSQRQRVTGLIPKFAASRQALYRYRHAKLDKERKGSDDEQEKGVD